MHRPLPPPLLAAASLLAAFPLAAGEIARYTFPSEVLGRDYPYTVYLPDGYGESDLDYPTMYLLHGSFGNENGEFDPAKWESLNYTAYIDDYKAQELALLHRKRHADTATGGEHARSAARALIRR